VQGSALAQGPAQEATRVPAGAMRIPPEQVRLGVGGKHGQPKQVSSFDPRQRPIRILGHTAILSRRVPIPTRYAATGIRNEKAVVCRDKRTASGGSWSPLIGSSMACRCRLLLGR
jgi:hypothetical protein